jgi:hypothetical protein
MENQNPNEKGNDTAVALEAVNELENHIFIHSPDKHSENCNKCGKSPEHHRWKSPKPWALNDIYA